MAGGTRAFGGIGRRRILLGLAATAAGAALAPAAQAVLVAPDDERVHTEWVDYPAASGQLKAYLARPAGIETPLPSVIIVHESRGMHPHIQDIARRVALAGFMALAPDLLSAQGGTPDDADKARELANALVSDTVAADLVASMIYLRDRPDGGERVGAIGFGWGGSQVGRFAAMAPALDAAVIIYGRPPQEAQVGRIKMPLLLHYAALDNRNNEGLAAFEAAAKAARIRYSLVMHRGVDYGFFNDTNLSRYNARAAEALWTETIDFLKKVLG
jgi:carboxymethylenebutenolidase